MKICVGLPSRGRPLDMVASAISLIRLASGGHEVEIILGIDSDDHASLNMAHQMETLENCVALIHDRHEGLGDLVNSLVAACDPDAAFLLWSDRISVTTLQWDHELALGCMQYPNRPLWLDSVHLTGAGQFILPPAWRAAQGATCPGLFPFWFIDTAIEELDAYVHGFPRVALASKAAGPRGFKTNRMRDVAFWIDVFAATRLERLVQAAMIAKKLGVPTRDNKELFHYFAARDIEMKGRAAVLTDAFGELGPPDETYRAAKLKAEWLLAERRAS